MAAEMTFVVAVEETDDMLIDIRPESLVPAHVAPSMRPALLYLAGLLTSSQATMRSDLDTAARWLSAGACDAETLPWWLLRRPHTNALRAWLLASYTPSTANRILSAVRGAVRAAWDVGLISHEEMARACAVKNIKGGSRAPAGRAITDGEIGALLAVCRADPTPAGPRDAAIIGLGVYATLRRDEIARLPLDAYEREESVMRVVGKGRKVRSAHLTGGLIAAIEEWLTLRGAAPGPLFLAIRKNGAIQAAGISGASIHGMLAKRAEQAGVMGVKPHDMRRTAITNLLLSGADVLTVADQAGHEDANMTRRYDMRGERAKRDAVGRLHMAWKWGG